ncbi:MAG: hypothetical protein HC810_07045 [Acaryochloridaceae cyanobacterium RL_2_7]|nr:hypothetical protein [Acaryochloridaceae cyanobacterium RL_2_7]
MFLSGQIAEEEMNLQVSLYQLHQHADIQGTLQLIHNLKPQHIAFSHGQHDQLAELCAMEELTNRYHLHLPQKGQVLDILVIHSNLRSEEPSLAEMMWEGELSESTDEIQIRLPNNIKVDSRWDAIADSGIILATWQGENLIIQGVSQRELLHPQWQRLDGSVQSCLNCSDYLDGACQQTRSPLFSLKISPEGSCQYFRANEKKQ